VTPTTAIIGGTAVLATIGSVSAKEESGGDPGRVSKGKMAGNKEDPGGISYGVYQFATKSGHADEFVKQSKWKDDFKGLKAGTPEFSAKWEQIGHDPKQKQEFGEAQKTYWKEKVYPKAAELAANKGYDINNAGVADAIWSISVQHGPSGWESIMESAKKDMGGIVDPDPRKQIVALYEARKKYVMAVAKQNHDARYDREVKAALDKSYQSYDTGVASATDVAPTIPPIGEALDKGSVALKDAKVSSVSAPIINNTNTIINTGQQGTPMTFTSARENSRPALLEDHVYG